MPNAREIEDAYRAAGAAILRLGAVYGEHDYQHRFEPVLRRVRAGRTRIPVGAGTFLFSRVHVGDVAEAVLAALASPESSAQCFNIVQARTSPTGLLYREVIAAAGARMELVRVADEALPSDLRETAALSQHLLASPAKARAVLGWQDQAGHETLRRAVTWHLKHPPSGQDRDFSADDAALQGVSGTEG